MKTNKIIVRKQKDLIWPFDGTPYHQYTPLLADYATTITVDPFPCNMHNVDIIRKEVTRMEEIFPIGTVLTWIVLPHEPLARTNAWANWNHYYSDGTVKQEKIKELHKLTGTITFAGKRANIHPAMTKFLVSHEYGHQVDYWISACLKQEDKKNDDFSFRKLWMEARGIKKDLGGYGGGRYHNSVVEMIADEFRVVVAKTDTDFWQHTKVRPWAGKIANFWDEMKEKYAFKKK